MRRWLWLLACGLFAAASSLMSWGPSHHAFLLYLAGAGVLAVAVLRFVAHAVRTDQQPPPPPPSAPVHVRDPGVVEGRVLPRGIER